jgi:competence protein ComEA
MGMIPKIAFAAAAVGIAVFVLWHPVRAPIVQAALTPAPIASPFAARYPGRRARGADSNSSDDVVVYVAGAVKRPGLYHLKAGDRNAQAVSMAGNLTAAADPAAVNLAQRVADGDEILVPAAGEVQSHGTRAHRQARRRHQPPAGGSIDVNRSSAAEMSMVPGIGRALAQRIVELRERQGSFASLDELLDVAGMTQTRLERARPYLRQP